MSSGAFFNQGDIIDIMVGFGFPKESQEVCCYGFSQMAINAYLSGNIEEYRKRVNFIRELTPQEINLINNFIHTESRDTRPIQHTKPNYGTLFTHQPHGVETTQTYPLAEIIAFIEGVSLYQQPQRHKDFFVIQELDQRKSISQFNNNADEIIQPSQLETDNNPIIRAQSWARVLSLKDLETVLTTIEDNMTTPFSVNLNNCGHSISVHYNPTERSWLVIDPNRLPGETLDRKSVG